MRYRRTLLPAASYFFTLNLLNRKSSLLLNEITILKFALRKIKIEHPFKLDAIVILPDHLHLLITLPLADSNYSKRLSLIKATFSKLIDKNEIISSSRSAKRERGIWQRRFWEHVIRDEQDYEHHINYIHYNPVKHGYVKRPSDWKYSSIHAYILQGILPIDWAIKEDITSRVNFGE